MPQANPQAAAQQRQLAEKLKEFWEEQMGEVEQVGTDPAEFKNHQLPLARIKKVDRPLPLLSTASRSGVCRSHSTL